MHSIGVWKGKMMTLTIMLAIFVVDMNVHGIFKALSNGGHIFPSAKLVIPTHGLWWPVTPVQIVLTTKQCLWSKVCFFFMYIHTRDRNGINVHCPNIHNLIMLCCSSITENQTALCTYLYAKNKFSILIRKWKYTLPSLCPPCSI